MDVIEPFWFAVTTVHDLIKANKEKAGEMRDLADTLKLISIAIRPLLSKAKTAMEIDPGTELVEVFTAMKSVIEDAEKTLREMAQEKKGRFHFITQAFTANRHIEEIKGYMEKLRNLTPILNLAINTAMHRKSKEKKFFSASKIIRNEDALPFWVQHFGDQEYKVSWARFEAAFEHEFADKLLGDATDVIENLRRTLDRNHDNEVDIYEYDCVTQSGDIWQVAQKAVGDKENAGRHDVRGRKRSRNDSPSRLNPNTCYNSPDRKKTKSMLPPVSPSPKSRIRPSSPRTPTTIRTSSPSSCRKYQMIMIGQPYIFELPDIREARLSLGRVFFEKLPAEMLVRISRQHCDIMREGDGCYVTDHSGNGTFVNGKLVGRGKKVLLEDGDRIGILMNRPDMKQVELGYVFRDRSNKM
ncbi:hypothetical protein PROFUN_04273 [Planoprotostelium fungivorum]|uniref:FHA domain-containing protein n=1 Tax=Planoprotostelium fungivorum TaxID=1890364 RepID=A0A2P6NV15_9EUKA|nr:hypothetical protein PROFUN_04273 [Planoprotostelium fungivorum]